MFNQGDKINRMNEARFADMIEEPRSFTEMVAEFRPRHISTPSQYVETQAALNLYLDLDREYTPDEADYVNLLGLVIERWEDDNYVWDDSPDDDDDDCMKLCDFGASC